jgi:histidinol-phosphate aminotransferase
VRIRPDIARTPPYRQGDQASPGAFKLSSNENPFDPLPGVVEAMHTATAVNRYPDASAPRLRARIAERFAVQPDAVHVSAGSVSILQQLALAATAPGDELVFAWRSFEGYPWMTVVAGSIPIAVPLRDDGRHDLEAMAEAVTARTRLIVVCSPNNPTGGIVTRAEFESFLDRVPDDLLVVLDEAYAEFVTDPEAVDGRGVIASGRRNVVVLRTFSKAYGLAGLRVGYAVGDPRILEAARITGVPLSVTAAAEAAALACLDFDAELDERVRGLVDRRDRLASILRDFGWHIPEAQGNFLWLPTGAHTASIAAAFAATGLVVRPFGEDGVRITIGEEASVERVRRSAASVLELLPAGHPGRREESFMNSPPTPGKPS